MAKKATKAKDAGHSHAGHSHAKPTKKSSNKASWVVAKLDDGTVQVTLTIPYADVLASQQEVAKEYAKTTEIPGFRPGKAPLEKVLEKIPQNTLLERALGRILPKLFGQAAEDQKLQPIIYPRFELIHAHPNEDWQIRAVTCELPQFELGDYKKIVSGALRTKGLWVPGKDTKEEEAKGGAARIEKEQEVTKALLEGIKITIPKILSEEETNSRLSRLLERLEKMGLNLESYLASIGKTTETLRQEYEQQSQDAIALDLILNKIADEENITITDAQIQEIVNASKADSKLSAEFESPEKRRVVENILRRRAALDSLISLT